MKPSRNQDIMEQSHDANGEVQLVSQTDVDDNSSEGEIVTQRRKVGDQWWDQLCQSGFFRIKTQFFA